MYIKLPISDQLKQALPVFSGAVLLVSFGMSLGWPSVTYGLLLNPEISPINITMEETALIAGFLMQGNSIGSLFASTRLLTSKVAILLSIVLQIGGWLIMFYSQEVYFFFVSRLCIGFANGFGVGQLKRYIWNSCESDLAAKLCKYLPIGTNIGVLVIFISGLILPFPQKSLISLVLCTTSLISFAIFAKNPQHCQTFSECIREYKVLKIFKDRDALKRLLVIFVTLFVLQYSGGAALIVYSEIIFYVSRNNQPEVCSIIYAVSALLSTVISIKYSKQLGRKWIFTLFSILCIASLIPVAIYYYYRQELLDVSELFSWLPLVLLIMYNVFHTLSYGNLAVSLISQNVPKDYLNLILIFWSIHHSLSALISTKIFQVIIVAYGMTAAFAFFVVVLSVGLCLNIFVNDFCEIYAAK